LLDEEKTKKANKMEFSSIIQDANLYKNVLPTQIVPMIDFVIPDKFNDETRSGLHTRSWLPLTMNAKRHVSKMCFLMLWKQGKKPEILLLRHFRSRGRVFSNQRRMMRITNGSTQELWFIFNVQFIGIPYNPLVVSKSHYRLLV